MDVETNYKDFVNVQGTVVNPLNYAPPMYKSQDKTDKSETDDKSWLEVDYDDEEDKQIMNRVPVSQLKHSPSKVDNNSKFKIGDEKHKKVYNGFEQILDSSNLYFSLRWIGFEGKGRQDFLSGL